MDQKDQNYGLLLNSDVKLHRIWFKQFLKLHGIRFIYRAPRADKDFDIHGDLDTNYYEPIAVYGILQDHPDQKTLKKMGWVAELQEGSLMLQVPYDTPHLEAGALFIIPSGLDNAVGRTFRVISMQTIMIYPAYITCEVAPEYETKEDKNTTKEFIQSDFNVLLDNEEDD